MRDTVDISQSIDVLEENLSKTARVEEWARLMGYNCPKKFARGFVSYFYIRPQKALGYVRLKSISEQLRKGKFTNFEIAVNHSIPDEVALNKFVNYHIGCSPRDFKKMPDQTVRKKLKGLITHNVVREIEKLGSKIR